jgi:ABC-type proline/glycine betaine transport system substrate-binding protein
MKNIKRLLIAATLLLSLVGGASQASADPGTPFGITPAGITWESAPVDLLLGITWE